MKHTAFLLGITVTAAACGATERLDNLTLEQATRMALQNHRSLRVAQAGLQLAEAQYQQAMAAFGPRVSMEAGFQRADQDRTFSFAGAIQTPAMDLSSTLNGVLGPVIAGLPPATQQQIGMALAQGGATVASQTIPMNVEVKMFDRDVTKAALNLTYPIYTGGKREAVTAMAQKGSQIAREEQRKTALEVVRDVNKYYHGAVFAQQMATLSSDTLERFQVLEDLTDRLYQNTSLKVKKTDYLRSKTATALIRSAAQEAKYASALTKDALANAMGLAPDAQLSLALDDATPALDNSLESLISDAMVFNPDKQRLELAIAVSEHQIADAKSAYLPMVGLEASVYQVWNGYKDGLFNEANRSGWTLGVGLKWDLFDGGLAHANVDAAYASKSKLEAQRVLLANGLALQIKDDVMRIQRSRAQVLDSTKAQGFAEENRKLNVRAYQEEMVETKEVIEAQLMESFAGASLYRAQLELRAALADLDYQVGKVAQQARP
jgi:outer membrane protein TolC